MFCTVGDATMGDVWRYRGNEQDKLRLRSTPRVPTLSCTMKIKRMQEQNIFRDVARVGFNLEEPEPRLL